MARELHHGQRGLDGRRNVTQRPARRAVVALGALGAADQAEPQPSGAEQLGDVLGEPRAVSSLVEDVETAAVEHQVERPARYVVCEKVQRVQLQ